MFKRLAAAVILCLVASPGAYAAHSLGSEQLGTISIPKAHVFRMPLVKDTGNIVPGDYPMHYAGSAMPCGDWTAEIAAHHYTHALPGADGGPFRHLDELQPGQSIYIQMSAQYGGQTCRYVERKQVSVWCGTSLYDINYCPASEAYFTHLSRRQLIATTCEGNGDRRRFVYFDYAGPSQT